MYSLMNSSVYFPWDKHTTEIGNGTILWFKPETAPQTHICNIWLARCFQGCRAIWGQAGRSLEVVLTMVPVSCASHSLFPDLSRCEETLLLTPTNVNATRLSSPRWARISPENVNLSTSVRQWSDQCIRN